MASLGLLVLGSFNNCDVYSDSSLFNSLNSFCEGNECLKANPDYLEIRINTDNDFPIPSGTADFNIGGDCNESGFQDNIITWELILNGQIVRTSNALALNGVCDKGRFTLYIVLGPYGTDTVNRTGLQVPPSNNRLEHILEVEIIGIDYEGKTYRNSLIGRKRIYLKPI